MDPKLAVGGPKPISGTGLSGVEEILWKWFSFVAFGLGTSAAERGIGTILLSALWSREKQDIDARGWWVGGGGREWTEAEGGQNIITINIIFSGAGRKRMSRRESEMGLMKYRSEMVSPLRQRSLQAGTRYLCLISFIFRLWLRRRAVWEERRDRERQWEGERAGEELFSLLWSTEKTRDWEDKACEWEGGRRQRALCRV